MTTEGLHNQESLQKSIKSSLHKAEQTASRLQKTYRRLLVGSTVGSALATFVAGLTAAQGPVVAEGVPGWRLACIVAAGFGFVSTLSSGASQQLKVSDRYLEGKECAGKLKSLQVMITTGSRSREEIAREYEGIVRTYPDLVS